MRQTNTTLELRPPLVDSARFYSVIHKHFQLFLSVAVKNCFSVVWKRFCQFPQFPRVVIFDFSVMYICIQKMGCTCSAQRKKCPAREIHLQGGGRIWSSFKDLEHVTYTRMTIWYTLKYCKISLKKWSKRWGPGSNRLVYSKKRWL